MLANIVWVPSLLTRATALASAGSACPWEQPPPAISAYNWPLKNSTSATPNSPAAGAKDDGKLSATVVRTPFESILDTRPLLPPPHGPTGGGTCRHWPTVEV